MNYYNEIKNELLNNEINRKVKNYSINRSDLSTYYNVGKMISDDGKHYGDNIIKQHSKRLKIEVHKKYNTTLLKRIRQFYWLIEKGATLSHQLSWSHYVELLPIKNIDEINYYINQICINNISIRTFQSFSDNDDNTVNLLSDKKEFIVTNEKPLKLTTPTMDAGEIFILSLIK